LFFFWNAAVLTAQSGDSDKEKGFVLTETIQGDRNAIGTITKLDTMAGYRFNPHFEMGVGIPFYFVRASSESAALGAASGNGIGNAYFRLRFIASSTTATFVSSITGSAPTGDADRGFSTGRATVDWNNYLGFAAGRITPFMNLGLANSISDTRFFTRPFTSLGKVVHFEGGAYIQVWRLIDVGASGYSYIPFGDQKVYSRLVMDTQTSLPVPDTGSGRGRRSGVFESRRVTVGDASIARDGGGSVWIDVNPRGAVALEAGYSRSVEYDLSSIFFSVYLNLSSWIRSSH
jgi:hypothetical protein